MAINLYALVGALILTGLVVAVAKKKTATSRHRLVRIIFQSFSPGAGTLGMGINHIDEITPHQSHGAKVDVARDRDSAKRLVFGLAQMNMVVLFMDGPADTIQDTNSKLIYDILTTLQIKFRSVDVSADGTMHLGLPAPVGNNPQLPLLYVDGLPVGGADTLTAMTRDGRLIDIFTKKAVAFDPAVAHQLQK